MVTCARQGLALAISIKLAAMNEKSQRLSIDSPQSEFAAGASSP
jgi:hypothetical protein